VFIIEAAHLNIFICLRPDIILRFVIVPRRAALW
jgi:hypothetical protein